MCLVSHEPCCTHNTHTHTCKTYQCTERSTLMCSAAHRACLAAFVTHMVSFFVRACVHDHGRHEHVCVCVCALAAPGSVASAVREVFRAAQLEPALQGLSHRERLQAGIRELNAEFFGPLLA